MDIIKYIFIVIVLLCVILLWRNNSVFYYKAELNYRCNIICQTYARSRSYRSNYFTNVMLPMWYSIQSISYNKMLFMFWRPLKDEYWLTKEQRDFLNSSLKYNDKQTDRRTKGKHN